MQSGGREYGEKTVPKSSSMKTGPTGPVASYSPDMHRRSTMISLILCYTALVYVY